MIPAPSVYIGGHLMSGDAADIRPIQAGLTLTWGTDSAIDFEDPAKLNFEVLLKPGAGFVSGVGTEVAVTTGGRTFFAGRIAGLNSRRHPSRKDSRELAVTCADTLADLVALRVARAEFPRALNSGSRIQHLRNILAPAGWEITGEGRHAWPAADEQRWISAEVLPLIDMHARGTVARRHNTSTYSPETGIRRRITFTHERLNTTPGSSTPIVRLPASNIGADLLWEKNPDDLVTDVRVTRNRLHPLAEDDDESSQFKPWPGHYINGDTTALQRAYGTRQAAFDIDTDPGLPYYGNNPDTASPLIGHIVRQWVNTDAAWRPTSVKIADSRLMSDASVYDLLDVTRRGMAYVVLTGLPAGNPSGFSRVEAYVTGGTAVWNGTHWEFDLTLGRQTAASGPL